MATTTTTAAASVPAPESEKVRRLSIESVESITTNNTRYILDVKKKPASQKDTFLAYWIKYCVILPTSKPKFYFDCFVGLLILYSVFIVPINIGFGLESKGGVYVANIVVDVIFAIDLIVAFFTAYEEDEKLVVTPRKIAFHYFITWFFPDLLSTLPLDLIIPMITGDIAPAVLRSVKLIRMLKLFRLLKMLRITRLNRKIREARSSENVHPMFYSLISLFCRLFVAAHLFSCMFYLISGCGRDDEADWVQCGGESLASKYLLSLYWTELTMLSVGYGDVVLTTNLGRSYSILVMACGAIFFGFIVATISDTIKQINPQEQAKKEKMTEIIDYMTEKRLPKNLKRIIWKHFEYYYHKRSTFPEDEILDSMPLMLQQQILENTRGELSNLNMFQKEDYGTLLNILRHMQPMFAEAKEVIVKEGDYCVDMFFVIRGLIHAHKKHKLTEGRLILVGIYGNGTHFGVDHVYDSNNNSWANYSAAIFTDLMWLNYKRVKQAMRQSKKMEEFFKANAEVEKTQTDEIAGYVDKYSMLDDHRIAAKIVYNNKIIEMKLVDRSMIGTDKDEEKIVKEYKTVRYAGKDAKGEDIYEHAFETSAAMLKRFVINPHSKRKLEFDSLVGLFALFSTLTLPLRFGFDIRVSNFWYATDILTEALFGIDLIVCFFTAYEQSDFVLNTIHSHIAKKYLKSSFILDFLSAVPMYRLTSASAAGEVIIFLRATKLYRLFRLFRLARLFRISKAFQFFSKDSSKFNSDQVNFREVLTKIGKLAVYFLFLTHITACFWSWLSLDRHGRTWSNTLGVEDDDILGKYVAALYWTFATMTTLGYGDIVPENDVERICAIVVMVMGSTFLAYIVGTISNTTLIGADIRQEKKVSLVRDYLAEQGTPKLLRDAVMRHFCYAIEKRAGFDERRLWNCLPHHIRLDTITTVCKYAADKLPIVSKIQNSEMALLFMHSEPCFATAQSYVYNFETGSGGIYFILRGIAEVVDDGDDMEGDEVIVSEISTGLFFGYEYMFGKTTDYVGIRAKTDLSMLWISYVNIELLKFELPLVYERLYNFIESSLTESSKKERVKQRREPIVRKQTTIGELLNWIANDEDCDIFTNASQIGGEAVNRGGKPSNMLSVNSRDRYNQIKSRPSFKVYPTPDNSDGSAIGKLYSSGRNSYANLYGSRIKLKYSPRMPDVSEKEKAIELFKRKSTVSVSTEVVEVSESLNGLFSDEEGQEQ